MHELSIGKDDGEPDIEIPAVFVSKKVGDMLNGARCLLQHRPALQRCPCKPPLRALFRRQLCSGLLCIAVVRSL